MVAEALNVVLIKSIENFKTDLSRYGILYTLVYFSKSIKSNLVSRNFAVQIRQSFNLITLPNALLRISA